MALDSLTYTLPQKKLICRNLLLQGHILVSWMLFHGSHSQGIQLLGTSQCSSNMELYLDLEKMG